MDTLVEKIEMQATVVRSCEADEQLKISSRNTGNIDIKYRKSGGDKIRGGLITSKRTYSKDEVICDRQQSVPKTGSNGRPLSMQPRHRQPAGEDGWVREEEEDSNCSGTVQTVSITAKPLGQATCILSKNFRKIHPKRQTN